MSLAPLRPTHFFRRSIRRSPDHLLCLAIGP
jgi:hypothetical protein